MKTESIIKGLKKLNERDRLKVLQEIIHLRKEKKKKRSITELAGLGKEIWKGIDVDDYIKKLRSEWD